MYGNVVDAVNYVADLMTEADEVTVRGMKTRELLMVPFNIHFTRERFIVDPRRYVNPFAQVAETLWMLSGRNDLDWLEKYIPQCKKFSDDGKTWRAGYGPRLRNWGQRSWVDMTAPIREVGAVPGTGTDQIEEVINKLVDDPFTRQAVIMLWDPAKDWVEGSKDYPCFTGNTLVNSPEGDLPISAIPVGYPVYSVDENYNVEIKPVTHVIKSGAKQIYEVHLSDGSVLETTEDHPFMIYENGDYVWVAASTLQLGDRLASLYKVIDNKGYIRIKKTLRGNTSSDNVVFEHAHYYEQCVEAYADDYVIHHINGVKADNSLQNLRCISKVDHDLLSSLEHVGATNQKNKGVVNYVPYTEQRERRFTYAHTRDEYLAFGREIIATHGKLNWTLYYAALLATEDYYHTDIVHMFGSYGEFKRVLYEDFIEQNGMSIVSTYTEPVQVKSRSPLVNVVKVVKTARYEDVYDITVADNHNFFVGESRVLVHNCNNWLHFIIRDNKLHLNVGVRSNDLIWGFTHVDFFGWAVLQELVANCVGVELGKIHWNATSLHVYERHFELLDSIGLHSDFPLFDIYRSRKIGVQPLDVTRLEDFDSLLQMVFKSLEGGAIPEEPMHIIEEESPWLFDAVTLLIAYDGYTLTQKLPDHRNMLLTRVGQLLMTLPIMLDMKIAAVFWMLQKVPDFYNYIILHEDERKLLDEIQNYAKT